MKLVLLPGLDGTGDLFSPLLRALSDFECEVIRLPETGAQDYASITRFVKEKLPEEDFILVAESFSGPIGAALAKEGIDSLTGVIFVATFLSAPSSILLAIAQLLPLKLLSNLPFAKHFHKALFLGAKASNELTHLFISTVRSLPSVLIKARLSSMHSLTFSADEIELPVGYIQAASDKLVSPDKFFEFDNYFNNISIRKIEGPHFILQANPTACAAAITELATLLTKQMTQ